MPPVPLEYQGRDVVARFYATIFGRGGIYRPRADTGQWSARVRGLPPRPHRCIRHGAGLLVLTLVGDRISALTRFDNDVLRHSDCHDRSRLTAMAYLNQPWFNREIVTGSRWRPA